MGTWPVIIVLVLTLIPTVILWVMCGRFYCDAGYPGKKVRFLHEQGSADRSAAVKWEFRATLVGLPWTIAGIILVNSSHVDGKYFLTWWTVLLVGSITYSTAFYLGGIFTHNRSLRPQPLRQAVDA